MTARHPMPPSPPERPRRPGFFARAMRNPLAFVMLLALPLGSVALAVVFLSYSGFFDNFTGPPQRTGPVINIEPRKTVKMTAPRISRFDKKSRAYVVTAATAEQDAENPNKVLLQKIRIEFRSKSDFGTVTVTAARGSYDADAEHLKLVSNIRVNTDNGYNAQLSSADVFLDQGRIASAEPVTFNTPFGSLQANGLDILERGQTIHFLDRARMVITSTRGDTG